MNIVGTRTTVESGVTVHVSPEHLWAEMVRRILKHHALSPDYVLVDGFWCEDTEARSGRVSYIRVREAHVDEIDLMDHIKTMTATLKFETKEIWE